MMMQVLILQIINTKKDMKTNIYTIANYEILTNLLNALMLNNASNTEFKKAKKDIEKYISENEISLTYENLKNLFIQKNLEKHSKEFLKAKEEFFNFSHLANIVFFELSKNQLYTQMANELKKNNITVTEFIKNYYSRVDSEGNILIQKAYLYKKKVDNDLDELFSLNDFLLVYKYEKLDYTSTRAKNIVVKVLEDCFKRFNYYYARNIIKESQFYFINTYEVNSVAKVKTIKFKDGTILSTPSKIILDTEKYSEYSEYNSEIKKELILKMNLF